MWIERGKIDGEKNEERKEKDNREKWKRR